MRKRIILAVAVVVLAGCTPSEKIGKARSAHQTYPQPYRSSTALLVLERNGAPSIMTSGFLIEKEKGIFMTAKHFTDSIQASESDTCKLFANGIVYDAFIMRVPPLRDAALVKIVGDFNPADLSDANPVASGGVVKGDEVFVRGVHWHSYLLRDLNRKENAPDEVVPIMKEYYGVVQQDPNREREFVFDNLEGRVVNAVVNINIDTNGEATVLNQIKHDANVYFQIRTERNHRVSFAGLSGGPVLNLKGELVGLITAEDALRYEIMPAKDPKTEKLLGIRKQVVADTLAITPITSVRDLLEYAKEAR